MNTANYRIGLSSCGKIPDEKLFCSLSNAGITELEISAGAETLETLDYHVITELSKKTGVHLNSFHLPFAPFDRIDISSTDKDLRGKSVEYLSGLIKKAADAGIRLYVIHSSGEPIADPDRRKKTELAKESLVRLQKTALACGGTVCIENLPRTCLGRNSSEIIDLLSADDSLRCCFDTNHLLSENSVQFIRRIAGKIVTLHVSDYDFVNERHWMPGEGRLDFSDILNTLKDVGYAGPWLYEIGYACPKTLFRPRDLTAEDFAQNARELFSGKKPTVISTPKPNLGYWE